MSKQKAVVVVAAEEHSQILEEQLLTWHAIIVGCWTSRVWCVAGQTT